MKKLMCSGMEIVMKDEEMIETRKHSDAMRWNTITLVITGILTVLTLGMYIYVYTQGIIHVKLEGFCVTGFAIGIDRFRGLYAFLCSLIWFVAMLVARNMLRDMKHAGRFYIGTLLTYVATLGIFYADDLSVVYILFEVMSICSYMWVAQNQNAESKKASDTYLLVSVTSGLVMLFGVVVLYCNLGTMQFGLMREIVLNGQVSKGALYLGAGCLLFGFGAKAGAFPMHFYLHSAYPASPAPAAAILSAALTKAGIFGILILTGEVCYRDTNWAMALVMIGVITMLFNAVWGLFQMNIIRILACSSVSQLGFIILGCGMIGMLGEESALAVQGTILYMVNHSLFKLILFLACGMLCAQAGSRNLNQLRGIGRRYKKLMLPVLTGCTGLAGIPLFSGYIAKTLLHESIVEYCHMTGANILFRVIEWLFLIAGGCTFAYVTKIFVILFVEKETKDSILTDKTVAGDLVGTVAVWIPTVLSLAGGLLPYVTMNKISELEHEYYHMHVISYFSIENLKGACISMVIGTCIYLLLVRPYLSQSERLPQWMSLEKYVYEPLFVKVLPTIGGGFAKLLDGITPIANQGIVIVLAACGKAMDGLVPMLQKIGVTVLSFGAKVCSIASDEFILLLQGTVFNSNKYIHLKRNENAELLMREVSQTTRVIQASLSFGFLMVCLGLCVTLVYLLL